MLARTRGNWRAVLMLGALALAACDREKQTSPPKPSDDVTVLRVESPSPEQPGAEHCAKAGQDCHPLAAQQKFAPQGVVRTFAGGKLSLRLGNGKRIDLDSLSELSLDKKGVDLTQGDFALESTPLIKKEAWSPLEVSVAGKTLSLSKTSESSSSFSVSSDEALVTVRRGTLTGLGEIEGPMAGQSFRLASAGVFRTNSSGQELPTLPALAPRRESYGPLLPIRENTAPRGLGTMSARLPNTDQTRDGVSLAKHHVKVTIRDGFARTEIEEEFANSSPHVLEGRYRFPLPGDASLSRLALWVGDELVEGEVLERKRAQSIYESIVDRPVPRDPALLEWMTGGEMSLKVFPILPKKSRRLIVAYNQALSSEGGVLRYVYPLSLGQGRENEIADFSISLTASDSQAKLRRPRVSGYNARLGQEGSSIRAHLTMKGAAPQRDFIFEVARDIGDEAQLSTFAKSPSDAEQKVFALRVSADLPPDQARPSALAVDRVLVLDVSHSQSLETIRAQGALAYATIRDMEASERVALLACDSACSLYLPPGSGAPRAEAARDWLLELLPGGSSDLAGALVRASRELAALAPQKPDRKRQIVLMSDGQASSGDLTAAAIAHRSARVLQEEQIELHLIGVGRTLDEDTLFALAVELGATWDRLDSPSSLEQRIEELALDLRKPTVKNARLTLPAGLRSEEALRLPALRLGQEVIIHGEAETTFEGTVVLSGTLAGAPYRSERSVSSTTASTNPLVPRLWARARIKTLQALPPTPELKNEIVAISTSQRTMSRYTSFLVLENEDMFKKFGIERTSTKADDQADALFDAHRFAPAPLPSETGDALSFEQLETPAPAQAPPSGADGLGSGFGSGLGRIGVSGSASRAAAPQSPQAKRKPRPAPSPRPAPRPKGASAPAPRPATSSHFAHEKLADQDSERRLSHHPTEQEILAPPPRQRSPYRAHLRFQKADKEWRNWGQKRLSGLANKLERHQESRQVHEEYVRAHLMAGRFADALKVARAFTRLDPDYAPARELLAYSAVVNGDHELARQMLDVAVETSARDSQAHAQAARAFEAVGDSVRACAHYRSLAELQPALQEAVSRAETCWLDMLSPGQPRAAPAEGKPGQLQVEIECDADIEPGSCPSPVVIAPDGRVLSPWTPGVGRSEKQKVTFVKLRSGVYRVLIMGGGPAARGRVKLIGRYENQSFNFEGGALQTVAQVQVQFY